MIRGALLAVVGLAGVAGGLVHDTPSGLELFLGGVLLAASVASVKKRSP